MSIHAKQPSKLKCNATHLKSTLLTLNIYFDYWCEFILCEQLFFYNAIQTIMLNKFTSLPGLLFYPRKMYM